jgi:tetratricopeptide (TPR) repeat protein
MMFWSSSKARWLARLLLVSVLAGCQAGNDEQVVPEPDPAAAEAPVAEVVQGAEKVQEWQVSFRRQRLLGDLLYDALQALDQDRLLIPVNDNAYTRYRRVLALDPENDLALEGLQRIVARYLELAATASRQGRFAAAAEYIDRARFVDRDDPAIVAAEKALEADRNSGDLVFELNLDQLSAQSDDLVEQLADIAEQAVEFEAFVWITAPSDEKGRWIYGTLRERANGYRLRGNIELGGRAIIRLRLPEGADTEAGPGAEPS